MPGTWDLIVTIGGKTYATRPPTFANDLAVVELGRFPDVAKFAALGKLLLTPHSAVTDPQFSIEQWGMLIVAVYTYRKMMLSKFNANGRVV